MPVHRGNIVQVIIDAWEAARDKKVEGEDSGEVNRNRSRNWVDALAAEFKRRYCGKRYRTFWLRNGKNQKQFRRNEFLFDVMVCSVSTTESLQSKSNLLEFIAECHWQIESEFNKTDTREIIIDMSKLVMGSATHKLFVAAHRGKTNEETEENTKILKQVSELAKRCGGHVYFVFVAHPEDWGEEKPESLRPEVHEWVADGWEKLPLTIEVP